MTSEIAAGRIRNLRDYVVPNKKIVCKVLKVFPDHIELSLRRVTSHEREEVMEKAKKEKTLSSMLKTIHAKDPEKIIEKIKSSLDVPEFLEDAREDIKLIEKFLPKTEAQKLHKILSEKKDTLKTVRSLLILKSYSHSGLEYKKFILSIKQDEITIAYLGSSKFEIQSTAKTYKDANSLLEQALESIKEKAQEKQASLVIKDAKK